MLPKFEDSHSPALTLVRTASEASDTRLVLRLWITGIKLKNEAGSVQPLLVGSVVEE